MIDTIQRAKYALWNCYHKLNPDIEVNPKGYIKDSKKNLIQPEWIGKTNRDQVLLFSILLLGKKT
jgi:hypothetical protein